MLKDGKEFIIPAGISLAGSSRCDETCDKVWVCTHKDPYSSLNRANELVLDLDQE
jgi:hypothetical protein